MTLCCPLVSSPLRCSSVLQHEPPGAAAPKPAGGRLAAVPPTLVRHRSAQHGPQPDPAQRWTTLRPEPRYHRHQLHLNTPEIHKQATIHLQINRVQINLLNTDVWSCINQSLNMITWLHHDLTSLFLYMELIKPLYLPLRITVIPSPYPGVQDQLDIGTLDWNFQDYALNMKTHRESVISFTYWFIGGLAHE